MIAKILTKSATFDAVIYNDKKVMKGVAELLEMRNMGYIESMNASRTTEATRKFFVEYSNQNDRIKYPQFHVVLSCKGHELDKSELLEMAHKYMDGMGYDHNVQPMMVYFHHDTDNYHVHVITSRVKPNGEKIDHNFEKARSSKVINELMNVNLDEETKEAVTEALKYKFNSIGQFQAILESMGYESYQEDQSLRIKKGGGVVMSLDIQTVKDAFKEPERDKKRDSQIKALLSKFQKMSGSKEDLAKYMKDMFNISLVFVGKKDSPYGYFIIDNKYGVVYKGSSIMKVKDLLDFKTFDDRKEEVKKVIEENLAVNPRLTSKSINSYIRRRGAYLDLKKAVVKIGKQSFDIDEEIITQVKHNDRVNFVQGFSPSSEKELSALCTVFKIAPSDLEIKDVKREVLNLEDAITSFSAILHNCHDRQQLFDALNDANIILVKGEDDYVAIDIHRRSVFSLSENGIDIKNVMSRDMTKERTKAIEIQKQSNQPKINVGRINLNEGQASNGINYNEDEGRKTNWERLEGEGGLKR